jgi:LmbE family N-acetylglucosaminyl deacetylase
MSDTDTSLRLMVILAQPDSASFDTSATAIRYAAQGVDITLVTAAGAQRRRSASPRQPRALREVVSLESVDGELDQVEPEQIICELVAHIRRVQPHVVITSGPFDGCGDADRLTISQFATAAVMRAADPRYGHTCCSRRPHAVSKLDYTATGDSITTRIGACEPEPGDMYYRAFSIVNGGRTLGSDLFEGLRQHNSHVAVAA